MMVYMMFVPVLVFQTLLIARLWKIRRDDQVKFRFCEFQRSTIAFLATEEGKSLANRDYTFVRWLIDVNSATTKQFNIIKTGFNISYTLKNLRFFDRKVIEPAHNLYGIENEKVKELYHLFVDCTSKAFVAYTPFLKWKFFLRFCLAAAKLLGSIGMKHALSRTRAFVDHWTSISSEATGYCAA